MFISLFSRERNLKYIPTDLSSGSDGEGAPFLPASITSSWEEVFDEVSINMSIWASSWEAESDTSGSGSGTIATGFTCR